MANIVKFIRTRTEFRINERKTGKEAKKWCNGKASLKGFHCRVHKYQENCICIRIFAVRKELGCTEVYVSLMHTAAFPRVQMCGREGGGDGDHLLSSELISKPSVLLKPSKIP